MSETMGFLAPSSPLSSPPAPFPATPRLSAVLQFVLRRRAAAAVRTALNPSCYQRRCRFLVVRATWYYPVPPHRLPPSKVHASAPPSPALYHVLPRTSPFSNINICSVFPRPVSRPMPRSRPSVRRTSACGAHGRVPVPGALTVTTAMLHRRGSDHRDAPSSWLGPGRCRGCPGARGAGVAAGGAQAWLADPGGVTGTTCTGRQSRPFGRAPPPWRNPLYREPPPWRQRRPSAGNSFSSERTTPTATSSSQTCANSWERVEGVSRSLPYSDLLALTSSHMFLSVMNRLPWCWRSVVAWSYR